MALRDQASLAALTEDVVKTSEIEGEQLNVASVRSSIARKLGVDIGALAPVDRHVEGVVEMVLDATANGLHGNLGSDAQIASDDPLRVPSVVPFAVALYALIIVGSSNAVYLTDGLDGLATGCSLTTALAYAGFGYVCGNVKYSDYLGVAHHTLANELPIVALALAGACVGFLCSHGASLRTSPVMPRLLRP